MNRLCSLVAVLAVSTAQAGTVIHVDDDAALGGDGVSWDTAYKFLQDALADAEASAAAEIRVAQGVYRPDRDEAGNVVLNDRSASFQLVQGVTLLGGYAGAGAPNPDDRDIDSYGTVLTGDLFGNDTAGFGNTNENSFHVVTGAGGPTTLLDGFTITAGNANMASPDKRGGGFWAVESSPTL